MPGKSETTPALAFKVFVEMGEGRSMRGLEKRLKAMGHKPSRSTLMRWAEQGQWAQAVQDGDELQVQAKSIGLAAAEVVEKLADAPPASIPFTVVETFEGTANALHNMTATMANVVQAAMQRYLERGDAVSIGMDELLSIARVTVDLGKATADMHKALQPAPLPPSKAKQAPERDPETGLLIGAAIPGTVGGPPGVDDLIRAFDNPPITRE